MPQLATEAKAREHIDTLLTAAGWTLQDYTRFDASASRYIALPEIPLTHGRCDYLLLIDRDPLGVIEAKKAGTRLSMVAEQSAFYGANLPDFLQRTTGPLPFYYESTGVETFFRDARDPDSRSRRVFAFHRPDTLLEALSDPDTLRARLRVLPPLAAGGMRTCQIGRACVE
jgi:type I restriction enzyme R subunit